MAAKISRYTVYSCTKKTPSVVTAQLCELNVRNCSTHKYALIPNRHKQWEVILCFMLSGVWVWLSHLLLEGQAVHNEKVINFQESFSNVRRRSTACTVWYSVHRTTEHSDQIYISCTLLQRSLSIMVVMETPL